MVHIQQLQVRGFKSFNKLTDLKFGPGLNCVVGPNGSGKSARADTEVLLSTGEVMPIGEIVEQSLEQSKTHIKLDDGVFTPENPLRIKTWGLEPKSMKIIEKDISAFIKRDGEPYLFTIKTKSGREVTTTGCHPVMVYKEEDVKSEIVENLSKGDFISTPNKLVFPERDVPIDLRGVTHWPYLGEDVARFLGYLIGDGCIPTQYRIDFINADREILEDYKTLIQKLNLKVSISKRKSTKAVTIYTSSRDFVSSLVKLFKNEYKREKKHIPSKVLFAKKHILASLLAALFDCDGTVSKSTPTYEYVTMSKRLSDNVLTALLRFGIVARRTVKKKCASNTKDKIKRDYYHIVIEGHEKLTKLYNFIPFKCEHKSEILRRWVNRKVIENTNIDILPKDVTLLIRKCKETLRVPGKPLRKQYPLFAAYLERRCCPSRQGLSRIIPIFKNKLKLFKDSLAELKPYQNTLIKIVRKLNLSMACAAKYIGITRSAIVDYWEKGTFNAKPKNLEKLYEYVKKELETRIIEGEKLLQILDNLSTSDIFWDQIVEIKKVEGEKYVYDLTIPNCHNFIGNGVFIHNSNVIDALCFALGQSSSKSLRADNYAELLYRSKDEQHAETAVVRFEVDNSNAVFPVDSKAVGIARIIKPNGSTQFKINGKNATRQQVVDLLAHGKINPDGHHIILQGDINRFVEMRSSERRQIVEEVAGINQYEQKKERAVKELDKIDERLKEAKIILTEKETYLNGLHDEKVEAEKYRDLDKNLKSTQATEIHLRMSKIKEDSKSSQEKLASIEKELEKLNGLVEKKKTKTKNLNDEINDIEAEIEKKGGEEQLYLQKTIEQLHIDLENSKNLIQNSKNEIQRIESRKTQLEKSLENINQKIDDSKSDKSKIEKDYSAIRKEIESIEKRSKLDSESLDETQKTLEKLENDIEELKSKRDEDNGKVHQLASKKEILAHKIKELENKVDELASQQSRVSQAAKARDRYKKIIEEINKLSNEDERLALELGNLRKLKIKQEDNIAQIKANVGAMDYILKRDRAISYINGLKKELKGIVGTVAELGQVDSKFNSALNVAAGSRMKNIVVQDPETAIRCLAELKKSKSGVATFLPLSKLAAFAKRAPSVPGVYGLACELVKCKKEYEKVFQYVFGDTIVIENTDVAQKLGINQYKMVTLDGDLFQKTGAITGGFRQKNSGLEFQETESKDLLDEEAKKFKEYKKAIEDLEKRREDLDSKTNNLRREKAELEGAIEAAKGLDLQDIKELAKEKKQMEDDLDSAEKEQSKLMKVIVGLDQQIDKIKVQRNLLNNRVKDLQFGRNAEEIKKLGRQEQELNAKLASLSAQLENALLPEQVNISRVIKELEKERKEFDAQIKEKEKNTSDIEKTLKSKEDEEKDFYGKLKALFKKKADKKDELDSISKEIETHLIQINSQSGEKNDLAIGKAKIESTLSGLEEEFSQFKDAELTDNLKTVNAAKNKIKELTEQLQSMGNVNMKALEIYEGLKQEYDKLAWRVSKLNSEKNDVVSVIDEIEKKKKSAFMETYEKLTENFSKLFNKMTDKGTATLVLDNPAEPFSGGIDVRIKHKEGKYMTLASLSGGEKVIVALALIFAIQDFSPAPFYLMDEIDAALDNVNSEKVAVLLREYANKSQVIMISHNDAIISAADHLYGVSMSEKGESNIVSLEL